MSQGWFVVLTALIYLLLLFVVASYGDRKKQSGAGIPGRPVIYALSLAIYCTSWTFFGSVGMASGSGFNFLAIYLGPILMVTVGHRLFARIIGVAKAQRITSIADFIASRYGKSTAVGAVATLIAVLGTVPYIALQLKAISTSVTIMVDHYQPNAVEDASRLVDTPLLVAILLAVFAILFGTRHADATEHQEGLVLAVAAESVIKLAAFLTVGLFVTYTMFDGLGDLLSQARASEPIVKIFSDGFSIGNFAVMTLLSFFAMILLPRQFHVGVVENHSEKELKRAKWLFPVYLILINLFVIPVALGGMLTFGINANADTFVLTLPILSGSSFIPMFAFVGGLSAATAMVIVACVALAIMISNDIVLPLFLRHSRLGDHVEFENMGRLLLRIRRTFIFLILFLAYIYFKAVGDSAALASIGLLSFAAVAQFAPAFFGGLIWRQATARGALWGMGAGFATWAYTLFLPTLFDPSSSFLINGPMQIEFLRPQALFGMDIAPLSHGVFWSLSINTLAYVIASLSRAPRINEQTQAAVFVPMGRTPAPSISLWNEPITVGDLRATVARYLGVERTNRSFDTFAQNENSPIIDDAIASNKVLQFAEQLLASAIGAASSRLVLSLLLKKFEASPKDTIALLDDASEALQYNRDLLQTALDQVEQGISVFDQDFRLTCWNRQFRILLNLPSSIGQVGTALTHIADTVVTREGGHEDAINDSDQLVEKLISSRTAWQLSLPSQERVLEILTNPMPDGGLVVSWSNISERVKAAAALRQANTTLERRVRERTEELTRLNVDLAQATEAADAANIGKTKFLAAVGHDIVQPLNAARLYSSALVERLADSESRELVQNMDQSLESVEDILSTVLAISRLDTGAFKPSLLNCSLDRILIQLQIELSPVAEEKGLKLRVELNDYHIRTDNSLLSRLLRNLLSNAIKYTKTGSVTVTSHLENNEVILEVKDTGIGIAHDQQGKIFNEFQRLDAGRRQAPGLGLGLSIVERISKVLDHSLTLISSEGNGSCFTVRIPLAKQKSTGDMTSVSAGRAIAADLSGTTVLCIDNDDNILNGMDRLLTSWQCSVLKAATLEQAVSCMKFETVDVIVADYHLDDSNGIDVVKQLRRQFKTDIPALLLTADRSDQVRKQAAKADMPVLNKPVKPAALRAALAQKRVKVPTAAE